MPATDGEPAEVLKPTRGAAAAAVPRALALPRVVGQGHARVTPAVAAAAFVARGS